MFIIIKLTGMILLTGASLFIGINESLRLKKRVQTLDWFSNFVDEIGDRIRCDAEELKRIFSRIPTSVDYITVQTPFSVTIKKCGLNRDDEKLLYEFFLKLGTGDVESQVNRCTAYKNMLSDRKSRAESEYNEKGRLYKMLGLFAGLGVSIILI